MVSSLATGGPEHVMSNFDDIAEAAARDPDMQIYGDDVLYYAPQCDPETIKAVIGAEHSDDMEGPGGGLDRRRVRTLTICTDPDCEWGGVALADLNLEEAYFTIGGTDPMDDAEGWAIERVIDANATTLTLSLLYVESLSVHRRGMHSQ